MVTEDMIAQAITRPVRSRHHNFQGIQQSAYDVLNHNGRRLYDNLRTQFEVTHADAFQAAFDRFGFCQVVFLNYPND